VIVARDPPGRIKPFALLLPWTHRVAVLCYRLMDSSASAPRAI